MVALETLLIVIARTIDGYLALKLLNRILPDKWKIELTPQRAVFAGMTGILGILFLLAASYFSHKYVFS